MAEFFPFAFAVFHFSTRASLSLAAC